MINKIKEWGGLVALIAIVLFFVFGRGGFKAGATITSNDVTATRFTQLLIDNGIVVSASGINVTGGQVNNGITTTYVRQAMITASSTLCSLASPAATSTLISATANFTTSASYATSYLFGNDSTAYSTTTSLGSIFAIPANGLATIIASSTPSGGAPIIAPSTFVNLKLSTTTAGASATYAPAGTCSGIFQAVN